MGTLVKRYWAPRNNCQPSAIYHCAVMPCFDKKLEASRDDFNLPGVLACACCRTKCLACPHRKYLVEQAKILDAFIGFIETIYQPQRDSRRTSHKEAVDYAAGTQIPETDSVLTTTELRQLLDQQGLDLSRVAEEEPDTILGGRSLDMAGVAGGSGVSTTYERGIQV